MELFPSGFPSFPSFLNVKWNLSPTPMPETPMQQPRRIRSIQNPEPFYPISLAIKMVSKIGVSQIIQVMAAHDFVLNPWMVRPGRCCLRSLDDAWPPSFRGGVPLAVFDSIMQMEEEDRPKTSHIDYHCDIHLQILW